MDILWFLMTWLYPDFENMKSSQKTNGWKIQDSKSASVSGLIPLSVALLQTNTAATLTQAHKEEESKVKSPIDSCWIIKIKDLTRRNVCLHATDSFEEHSQFVFIQNAFMIYGLFSQSHKGRTFTENTNDEYNHLPKFYLCVQIYPELHLTWLHQSDDFVLSLWPQMLHQMKFCQIKTFPDPLLTNKATSDLQMTNMSWNTSWWVLHKFQGVCSRWTISHLWVTNTEHPGLWCVSHHGWAQRWRSSRSRLRSINTPHLYFIYFTRGKSMRAFLPANGSYTVKLTRLQRCIERALKWGH